MICSVVGRFDTIFEHSNSYFREYMVALISNINKIIDLGYTTFLSEIICERDEDICTVISAFEKHKRNIYLEGILPYQTNEKNVFQRNLEKYCKKIHYVADDTDNKRAIRLLQKYMIDNSDATLFIWSGKNQGDIWNEIKYAREIGKQIFYINYSEFKGNVRIFS